MGFFLRAALEVLKEHGEPLSAKEIVDLATSRGLLQSKGVTPAYTMKSKLSTDILKNRDKSLFMRSEKGKFALREWKNKLTEFTADRYKKALYDEDIVVFASSALPLFVTEPGLSNKAPTNLISQLYNMRRRNAEENYEVIQLISVFIVRHKNRILTYKRTKRLPETRLHHYYSLAFGGHLNPDDISPLFNIFDPAQGEPWLFRELREELKLDSDALIKLIYRGLLYDPSRPVSKQHLGITYELLVNTEDFEIGERGFLMDAKFESVSEIQSRLDQFENWSQLLLDRLGSEWQ